MSNPPLPFLAPSFPASPTFIAYYVLQEAFPASCHSVFGLQELSISLPSLILYCIIPVVYLVPLSAFIILEGKKGDKLISMFSASTSLPGTQWALLKVGNRFKLISQSFCDLILPVILTKLPQIIFSLRERHEYDSHEPLLPSPTPLNNSESKANNCSFPTGVQPHNHTKQRQRKEKQAILPFAGISGDPCEGHPALRITGDSYFLDCQ